MSQLSGEKKLWLKGAPRSVEAASACKHLAVSPVVQPVQTVRMRPQANQIIAPHENGIAGMTLGNVDYWPGLPPLGLVCSCPQLVEDAVELSMKGVRNERGSFRRNPVDRARVENSESRCARAAVAR